MTECNLCAFDTEDDSKRFSDARQDHAGYEKVCTQIAAIDARTGERFHYRPTTTRKRARGRYTETVWDVQPFLDWLEARGPIRCFAHNLAYDIGNIWRDRLDELDITMVGNRLVRARWKNVTLLDSSNVWPMPLAKVGKSIGLEKMEMDVESEEYVFRDVEIVIEAMALAERICIQYGADMKSTLGSISISIWQAGVIGGVNWQSTMEDIRNAYYGGRVELFRTHAKGDNIYYTDINSLYPAMMLNKFPDGDDQYFDCEPLSQARVLLLGRWHSPRGCGVRIECVNPLDIRCPRSVGETGEHFRGPLGGTLAVHVFSVAEVVPLVGSLVVTAHIDLASSR